MTFKKPQKAGRGRPANTPASPLGERIRLRMSDLGIPTQAALAARLTERHPGMSWHPFQITRLMTGQKPTAERAAALADVLQCDTAWLITGEEPAAPSPTSPLGTQILDAMTMMNIPALRDLSRLSHVPLSELETAVRTGRIKRSTLSALADILDLSRETLAADARFPDPRSSAAIPILGRVAAGEPILAEQNLDGWVDVSQLVRHDDDTFALRVHGDSMVDAGLQNGDLALVRHQPEVENGDMAVIIIGDEATVKYLFDAGDEWLLQPANEHMKPITVPKNRPDIQVAGKVTGWIHQR